MMPDYRFYTEDYLGSRIPEKDFPQALARARDGLQRLEHCYRVCGGQEARRLALCAMAEAVYEDDRRDGLRSCRAGNVTVQYADDRSLWRELYRKAAIYLDIYRGAFYEVSAV